MGGRSVAFPHVLWGLPVLEALTDVPAFRRYLAASGTPADRGTLRGYQLLFRVLGYWHVLELEGDDALGLEVDWRTLGAYGASLEEEDLPTTTAHGRVRQRVGLAIRRLALAPTFEKAQQEAETLRTQYLRGLRTFADTCVEVAGRRVTERGADGIAIVDLEAALHACVFAYFTGNGGWRRQWRAALAGLEGEKRLRRERELFEGYRLGLAHLMGALLPSHPSVPAKIREAADWDALAREEKPTFDLITNLRTRAGLERLITPVTVRKPDALALFPDLVKSGPSPREPSSLDFVFGWTGVQRLDTHRTFSFIGGPLLAVLIEAETVEARAGRRELPLRVLRFKHPETPVWYSYAILLQMTETRDDRGWLLFLQVGGDYGGSGRVGYDLVEEALHRAGGIVAIEEHEVDVKVLADYAWKEHDPMSRDLDAQEIELRRLKARHAASLGLIQELGAKLLLEADPRYAEVHLRWQDPACLPRQWEIDVLAAGPREVLLVESQRSVSHADLVDLTREIVEKRGCLERAPAFQGRLIQAAILTSRRSATALQGDREAAALLEKAGIRLLAFEEDVIKKLPPLIRKQWLEIEPSRDSGPGAA